MIPVQKVLLVGVMCLLLSGTIATSATAQQIRQNREIESFEDIIVDGSSQTNVYVQYDPGTSVTVKTDRSNVANVKTVVSGKTLKIQVVRRAKDDVPVEIYIRLPILKKIILSGGGNVEFREGGTKDLLQTRVYDDDNVVLQ